MSTSEDEPEGWPPFPSQDSATRPAHYSGNSVLKLIEEFDLDFSSGNAVKYLCRAGRKAGEPVDRDLTKAFLYVGRQLFRRTGQIPLDALVEFIDDEA